MLILKIQKDIFVKILRTSNLKSFLFKLRSVNIFVRMSIRRKIFAAILFWIVVLLIIGAISISLGQDGTWDLRNYHFYNPYGFLRNRLRYDYNPAQLQTYLNPIQDFPFYFLVTNFGPKNTGFLMGILHGLNFIILFYLFRVIIDKIMPNYNNISLNEPCPCNSGKKYKACCNKKNITSKILVNRNINIISFLLSLAGFFSSINISELGTTKNDNFLSLFILLSLYLFITANDKSKKNLNILLSGLFMGVGAGFKLTNFIYLISFLLATLFIQENITRKFNLILRLTAGIILGFLLVRGYWMYLLFKHFKNPFFPFYNKIFKSPYYDLINIRDTRFLPHNIFEGLIYPFYFFWDNHYTKMFHNFRDYRISIIYLLVIIYIFLKLINRGRNISKKQFTYKYLVFFITFFTISLIVWIIQFSIYRYLCVLEFISPILLILLLAVIMKNWKKVALTALIIIALIIPTTKKMNVNRVNWSSSFFGIRIPKIEDLENSIIIIGGKRPWTYFIPFFPHSTRFIRVESNFLNYKHSKSLLYNEIRNVIDKHNGPIFLLTDDYYMFTDVNSLRRFNLKVNFDKYWNIYSKFDKRTKLFKLSKW